VYWTIGRRKESIILTPFIFISESMPEEKRINTNNNVELQISYLTDTIVYILKYYAEQEGMPSNVADEVAYDATRSFLNFFRRKRKEGKPAGRSFEAIAKDAVLLAARRKGIPIRNHKAVFRLLKVVGEEVPYSPLPYIDWLSYKLGISDKTKEKAKEIAETYKVKTLRRPAPRVIAASAIYVACLLTGERKTQGEIAHIAQCTEVSIRNNYQEMAKKLGIPLNDLKVY